MADLYKELIKLRNKVLKLGSLVETAIQDSVKSLVERKSDLAKKVIKRDKATLKITTDLERIGDLSVNIANRALELNKEPQLKPYIDIPRMAEIAREMVRDSLDAYVRGCTSIPYKILEIDTEIDNLMEQVFNELLFFMIQDPHTISRATRISHIAKALERIADHATNIAEMVIFMCEGKLKRHAVLTKKKK
jgi:phosphate transport system protein